MPGSQERPQPGLPKRTERPSLQEILREKKDITYEPGYVDIHRINVLPQGRKTFHDIDVLSEDIADKKLINPPLIARLDREAAKDYLDTVNAIHDTEIEINDLIQANEKEDYFDILIAGERRLRACKALDEVPCNKHSADGFTDGCLSEHFQDGIEVRISNNIPPIEAIFRQASENIHEAVPPYEEAHYYDHLLRAIRDSYPEYTLAQFARDVGRSPEKVDSALKYCIAPSDIQELVEDGSLAYGMGVQLGRLNKENAPEEDVEFFSRAAKVGRYTLQQFEETISNYLRSRQEDQNTIFSSEINDNLRDGNVLRIAERAYVPLAWGTISYYKHLAELFKRGQIGKEDSPFSSGSPLRLLKASISSQKDLLPHLRSLVDEDELRRQFEDLNEIEEVLDVLIEQTPVDEFSN